MTRACLKINPSRQTDILGASIRGRWVDKMMTMISVARMSFIFKALFEDIYLLLLNNRETNKFDVLKIRYDVQAVDCNSLRNHFCNWSSRNINSSQASRDPIKIKSVFPGRGQKTDLCRWTGIGKIVEEMQFYRTSCLFEHPFFFCHHLKSLPFVDFDDYMLSENFVLLDSEYFSSWRLIFELIFGLMNGIFTGWSSLEISHF